MALTLDQLRKAYETNATEAAGAFQRAFDIELQFGDQGPQSWNIEERDSLQVPGLILICQGNEEAALICFPAQDSLLPDWYTKPDPTQNGRLQGLALELGSLILPEEMEAFDCVAVAVSNLAQAIERGGLADDICSARYDLSVGDDAGQMYVTSPCVNSANVAADDDSDEVESTNQEIDDAEGNIASNDNIASNNDSASSETGDDGESTSVAAEQSIENVINHLNEAIDDDPDDQDGVKPDQDNSRQTKAGLDEADQPKSAHQKRESARQSDQPTANKGPHGNDSSRHDSEEDATLTLAQALRRSLPSDTDSALSYLPTYTKSLLRVPIPVSVTLAASKQSLQRIIEMSPGTIITFEKPCDAPLTVEVNQRNVAEGEVVRIGEKFGLRITSILAPPERFNGIKTRSRVSDSKDPPKR